MATTVLEYGRQPSRRRAAVRVGLRVVLFLLLTTGTFYAPRFWVRLHRLYCQRTCARYQMAADQVVYEEHALAAETLLGIKGYVSLEPTAESLGALKYFGLTPCHIAQCASAVAVRAVPDSLHTLVGGGGLRDQGALGVLFLGERRTASGCRYIVAVHPGGLLSPTEPMQFRFLITVVAPGTLLQQARTDKWASPTYAENLPIFSYPFPISGRFAPQPRRHPPLRMYAGQRDPNDAARFTIVYETEGKRGTVERIVVDGPEVQFRVIDGPRYAPVPIELSEFEVNADRNRKGDTPNPVRHGF